MIRPILSPWNTAFTSLRENEAEDKRRGSCVVFGYFRQDRGANKYEIVQALAAKASAELVQHSVRLGLISV